jgi:hypothetical protein
LNLVLLKRVDGKIRPFGIDVLIIFGKFFVRYVVWSLFFCQSVYLSPN